MTIGILGAGRLGLTVARLFAAAGHRVLVANSRRPSTLAVQVRGLGPDAAACSAEELVRRSDIVVLAVPWTQVPSVAARLGPWRDKIVVDATNNRYGPEPGDVYDLSGRGSSEIVAELLPGARLVKAFNHQPFASLAMLRPGRPSGKALFVAGDDQDAKRAVARLIEDIGGTPVDTGGLRDGGRLQATGGPLAGQGRLLEVDEARDLLTRVAGGTAT